MENVGCPTWARLQWQHEQHYPVLPMLAMFTCPCWQCLPAHAGNVYLPMLAVFTCPCCNVYLPMLAMFTCPCWQCLPAHAGNVYLPMLAVFTCPCWQCLPAHAGNVLPPSPRAAETHSPRRSTQVEKRMSESRPKPSTMRMYFRWSLCTLYLHACHVRVTAGD